MGEILGNFSLKFNGSVRVEARAERLTSDAGALLLREVDERLGLTGWLGHRLKDPRDGSRITHSLEELVRTHLLLLAQGWRDQSDVDALRQDAALRLAVSGRKSDGPLKEEEGQPGGLASQPTLSRLPWQAPARHTVPVDAFAHNEVRLLLNAMAYNLVHATRVLMEKASGEGWGLGRVRERVLKVPARLLLHSRRVVLVICQEAAERWQMLWSKLSALETAHIT